jgi:hypothetical protein
LDIPKALRLAAGLIEKHPQTIETAREELAVLESLDLDAIA